MQNIVDDIQVQKNEERTTALVERETQKVPSLAFLGLAVGSMVASAAFLLAGKKHIAMFIGQWAPSLLVIGVYNKLVKFENEMLPHIRETDRGY